MNDTTFKGNGNVSFIPVITSANPKPITNADRILAMTDEELAEWIDHIQADSYERGMMETPVVDYPNIYSGWLSWLKAPVEVDNGI